MLWVETLHKIAAPVFSNIANQTFKNKFPLKVYNGNLEEIARQTHLEALGRSMAGVGPWLNLHGLEGREKELQQKMVSDVIRSIHNATHPDSPDFMNFSVSIQPLVDAAFMAQGLLRAWDSVWLKLDGETQRNVILCMKTTRTITPLFNNWLLFSAMIEAFLMKTGEAYDSMRIDYAIRQHEQWYKGDGAYGDGPSFHWDYYNSFVIQPMMYDILAVTQLQNDRWSEFRDRIINRIVRYAAIQERLIARDGSYPPFGRSITYRFGAFHALALVAYKKILPSVMPPSSVRCALTAVLNKTLCAPETFDKEGWLQIGLCGHQPMLGEEYISTGSLYLSLCGFLPLGLSPKDDFWTQPDMPWTAVRIWDGENVARDKAISG